MMRAAHVAPRRADFSLRDRHGPSSPCNGVGVNAMALHAEGPNRARIEYETSPKVQPPGCPRPLRPKYGRFAAGDTFGSAQCPEEGLNRCAYLLIARGLAVGCVRTVRLAASDPPQRRTRRARQRPVRDAEACTSRGGTWRRVCLHGDLVVCRDPYATAERPAPTTTHCTGQCRYEGPERLAAGSPAKSAYVSATSDPCGCFAGSQTASSKASALRRLTGPWPISA